MEYLACAEPLRHTGLSAAAETLVIRLEATLRPNIGFTLRGTGGNSAVFTRSAITSQKVNRFG